MGKELVSFVASRDEEEISWNLGSLGVDVDVVLVLLI